jgi:hypothetical protein
MTERRRRSLAGVALATLALGIAARAWPLYWSPYPATLDGFRYAFLARTTLESGLPVVALSADELVFTSVLAVVSAVTGVPTVRVAQPMVAVTGGASCLTAVALVARIGRERGWSRQRLRVAAMAAGIGIAVEGLYIRRSGVPDEEAFGLLLVPILGLAAWRALQTRRYAWWVPTLALGLTMPPLHNMSGLVAGLTLTGLVAAALVRARGARDGAAALALGAGYWTVYFGYALVAPRFGLDLTYSGLLSGSLGLFVAWVALVGVVVAWSRAAPRPALRAVWLLPVGGWFVLVAVNSVVTIFPGTVPSPNSVALLIGAYVVPVALVGVGITLSRRGAGVPVLAAVLAPVALTYYALSATLTPGFFGLAIRVQSFAHLPAFVFVGLGVGLLVVRESSGQSRRSPRSPRSLATDGGQSSVTVGNTVSRLARVARVGVALLFVSSLLATVPLGYVDLDTGVPPSTTTPGEFQAAGFAERHVRGPYTTDHALSRVANHHFRNPDAVEDVNPTRSWLQGGPPPSCPVLAGEDWTTAGAHLFPAAPETLPPERYERFLVQRNVVYQSGGTDPHALVLPRESAGGSC